MRQTGILLPVFSLPSPWGVGELGSAAFRWIDILAKHGVSIWQILPMNPLGFGNSPYQPYSSFAGDELFLSLEALAEEGLLDELPLAFGEKNRVLYDRVRAWKEPYLRKACAKFLSSPTAEFEAFAAQSWVRTYGVFRALKKAAGGKCWNEWPQAWKSWPEDGKADLAPYEEEIRYHGFLQYFFLRQWTKLREYAGQKQIRIMGDVPFYVGVDSVDVWAGKKNFLLDEQGKPTYIAGVPPDYFSATGQRWGNPIYDWDYLKKSGYSFWVERLGYSQKLFDLVRIDHFRAFDTYWKIPVSCPTAVEGEWLEAPGYEVLDTVLEQLPGIQLVAEDLGELRPEVAELKNHYKFQGMRIVQFNLETNGKYARDSFRDHETLIAYTGTHDNATTREWYESLSVSGRRKLRKFLKRKGFSQGSLVRRMILYTLSGKAEYAVIPACDFLELGTQARLNMPGTVGSPNWEWRLGNLELFSKALSSYDREIRREATL